MNPSTWLKTRLGRVAAAAGGGVAILAGGALMAVVSTAPSDAAIERRRAFLIAEQARGDFSEARLKTILGHMHPGDAAMAARYDPALLQAASPVIPARKLDQDMLRLLPDLSLQQAAAVNAGFALSDAPNPPARPFSLKGASAQDRQRAADCMSQAIYYEAGFEPLEGAQAVAQVIINRVRHPAFPKTICGVVFEGSTQKTGCQFSFTCDGSLNRPPAPAAWKRAQDVAERALNGFVMAKIGGATHYHTRGVVPYWAPTLTKVSLVGSQIFYRWPGDWGLPTAFRGRYAGGESPGVDVGGEPMAVPGSRVTAQLQMAQPAAPARIVAQTDPAPTALQAVASPITALAAQDAPPQLMIGASPEVRGRSALGDLH